MEPQSSVTQPARQACERCWKRKQKCDRQRPTCGHCQDAKVVCRERLSTLPYDPTLGDSPIQVASGQSYFQNLKRRIQHLENVDREKRVRVEESSNREERQRTMEDLTARSIALPSPHGSAVNTASSQGYEHATRQEGTQADDQLLRHARGEFDHLVLSSIAAEGSPNQSERTQRLSTWRIIESALCGTPAAQSPAEQKSSTDLHSNTNGSIKLDVLVTRPLLKKYTRIVLQRYPFMDAGSLTQAHDLVIKDQNDGNDSTDQDKVQRQLLVYLAIATTAFSDDAIANKLLARQLHSLASDSLSHTPTATMPIGALRCLVALTLCSLYNEEAGSLWHLLGIAVSRAVSMGLHRIDQRHSPTNGESYDGSRIFWTLYILDRQVSSAYDRPFAIQMQEISTPSPRNHKPSQNKDNPDLLPDLVDHAHILSLLIEQSSMPPLYFSSMIASWRETASLHDLAKHDGYYHELMSWLDMQLIMVLYHDSRSKTILEGQQQQHTTGIYDDDERDQNTLIVCHEWLESFSDMAEEDLAIPCVFDPFLVARARITCQQIHQRQNATSRDDSTQHHAKSIEMLSISLLGSLSPRFSSAKELRKALILLHRVYSSQEVRGTLQRRESAFDGQSASQLLKWEQMKAIPRSLRRMLFVALES